MSLLLSRFTHFVFFVFFIVITKVDAQTLFSGSTQKIDTIYTKQLKKRIAKQWNDSLRYIIGQEAFTNLKLYKNSVQVEDEHIINGFRVAIRQLLFGRRGYANNMVEYYEYIHDNNFDDVKGDAKFFMAKYLDGKGCYYESITYYYEAIEEYIKINDDIRVVNGYLKLGRMFMKTGSQELSTEIDSILMEIQGDKPNLPRHLQNRILLFHASNIALNNRIDESIDLLKSVNPEEVFKKHHYLKRYYFHNLALRFIEKGIKDSALSYIDKMYSNPSATLLFDGAQKPLYKALAYYESNVYQTSLDYMIKAGSDDSFKRLSKNDRLRFYKLKYLLYKHFNKTNQALESYEIYSQEYARLKDINTAVLASAYKHKKSIENIKKEAAVKEQVYTEKKRLHIYYTVFMGVVFFSFIILLLYMVHRKQKERLLSENDKMKEIFMMRNRFIENISHEISTPITIMEGYLKLIGTNMMNYDVALQYLKSAKRNASSINHVFNDFLTALKLDQTHLDVNYKKDKLGVFLLESVHAFSVLGTIKNIEIYYKSNLSMKEDVAFEYDSLLKIMRNLLSNALKYSHAHSKIYVSTMISESYLCISVKDQGIGISEEDQTKIFDRFFQSNRNHQGGFGIGLSLIKSLLDQINGTITVNSKLGKGSLFEVQIPLLEKMFDHKLYDHEFENTYRLINAIAQKEIRHKKLPNILIIDDSIELINFMKDVLSDKFNCFFAFNGKEALEKIKEHNYDLIISDLIMPEMGGISLKKELNSFQNKEEVPFILMTSSNKEYNKDSAELSIGIDDYIIKPFGANELLVRIDNLLERNVYRKELNEEGIPTDYRGHHSRLIQKVCDIILDNMHNNEFTVKELAQQCGYSNKQLTLIVKEKTGLSPVKLILEYRLLKSYDLIIDQSHSTIKEIIFAVGLTSRAYFNKAFEHRFGLKPSDLVHKTKNNFSSV